MSKRIHQTDFPWLVEFLISDRYGDIFSFNLIEMHQIVICDLELLKEMFSKEVFSARGKPTVFGINLFGLLKGGHGGHGLMFNEGRHFRHYNMINLILLFHDL